jgi:serine protease AprX
MFDSLTRFTVLIERRATRHLWPVALLLLLTAALFAPPRAAAQSGRHFHAEQRLNKMSADLVEGLDAVRAPRERWQRDHRSGRRDVQVIFVVGQDDQDMTDLKRDIERAGGTIDVAMPGLRMLTATLPAGRVAKIAERNEVVQVVPNRPTSRSASILEGSVGATTSPARTASTKTTYTGPDGSGIGIAIVDSGVMKAHKAFDNASGVSRVKKNVQFLTTSQANWTDFASASMSLQPGSAALTAYEASIDNSAALVQDGYGHGTHVASIAAGRPATYATAPDLTGIAPNADIYDVKVLNDTGFGTLSDTLEGIQWVIYHAREYNIRVMNLSLAMDSTDSWQYDPLCIAARAAVGQGITVVVAAGNFGKNILGQETYGTVSSPGHEPSVITVGSANTKNTALRSDDVMNMFSSRGPTRGSFTNGSGNKVRDDLLKPDLVAPGNRIVGAGATRADAASPTWNNVAAVFYAPLVTATGITQTYRETQMYLSGTSVSAPVVAGAAAVLLQANPGLTPPMIKAILQYTAQPIAGANLLQQGAGMVNLAGAVTLAKVLRTDVSTAIAAGAIASGNTLLATGKTMPTARTTKISGETFNWSRIVYVGGNRVVTGDALFTKFQPIYNPRFTWAKGVVLENYADYWDANRLFPKWFWQVSAAGVKPLLTAGVVEGTTLLGASSAIGKTGVFTPSATLAGWFGAGSGTALATGVVVSEGVVISEGVVVSEGVVLSEGVVISEGVVLSEGVVISEGVVVSEGVVISENKLRNLYRPSPGVAP